jgi:uncharacterized protein (DUF362 family)
VNTNPLLVGAAAGAFLALGAKTVVVAEGPGNQRDTYLVLAQSGFESQLRDRKLSFVDLNRADVRQVKVTTPFTGLDSLWIPQSILAADVVVSMPRVKTHHWAGVTLSMKNMFGTIPGSVYGWPKNVLHWKGIDRSILDINSTVPAHFVIADGIVAMEGDGPLHGTARDLGRIVMSDDPVAAERQVMTLPSKLNARTRAKPKTDAHSAAMSLPDGRCAAHPHWRETGRPAPGEKCGRVRIP